MEVSHFDVAVLGAGPAGSTAAALLSQRGLRVVLLERERFPRFHIGESLAPWTAEALDALGLTDTLDARYLAKHAVRFQCCRTGRTQRYGYDEAASGRYTHGWEVPRADFDALLLDRARALGVSVCQPCEAEDILFERGFATAVRARHPDGRREGFGARVILDATGRDTLLCARIGGRHALPDLDRTALFAHYRGAERATGRDEGALEIITFPHGWLWVLPLRGGVTSVGAVVSPAWIRARRPAEALERFLDRTLDDAPVARDMLSRAARITPVRAVSSLAYAPAPVFGDAWLSIGDAAGFIDPLFCSGTLLALRGAVLAADAVADALRADDVSAPRFAAFAAETTRARELYLGLTRSFYDGDLQDTLFEARTRAARSPIASVLAGDVLGDDPVWRAALRQHAPR